MIRNNSRNDYRRRMAQRRRRQMMQNLPVLLLLLLLIALLSFGAFMIARQLRRPDGPGSPHSAETVPGLEHGDHGATSAVAPSESTSGPEASSQVPQTTAAQLEDLLADAARIAAGYDYDKAIETLKASEFWGTAPELDQAIAEYEEIKSTLQPYDVTKVTHVFFHTLVMDEDKAFDGDADTNGYNQVMTTRDEFLKILESMYEKGFVLVRLHDMAYQVPTEDGGFRMERGTILLPEGKQPFVMSQDDVCYYEYMEGDGFATRMIIGEDGKPTCEMKMDDGSVSVGSYDLVPLLEDFIEEHPDFSYRGARAVIAFTGYQGILGYRTAASYSQSPTYQQDCQDAAAVAQCLRDNGWELASHSWGHRDLGGISYSHFKTDSDKWEAEVESLIGPTDIILYPFGGDIGDWRPYTHDNDRFNYLKELGFSYFCNVDSAQYWVQIGDDFVRQGRRNLDGYRMWGDIQLGEDHSKRRLDDLFKAEDVFSSKRPTPVLWN